jgi:adenosine deaminase
MAPRSDEIAVAPKVLLHDHLDGGLRPATIVDLAEDIGHDLPTRDADELAAWFVDMASSGPLERYLETFSHTVAVMQQRDALVRVAAECAEDLASDNVVYAEVRYAPEQHLGRGFPAGRVAGSRRRAPDTRRHVVDGDAPCSQVRGDRRADRRPP